MAYLPSPTSWVGAKHLYECMAQISISGLISSGFKLSAFAELE